MEKPVTVTLRIPKPLHEQVARRANDDLRSVNAEIQWLITYALETLQAQERPAKPPD
jgi:hypothetical protein